jgi:GAF domain-containing protein
VTEYADALNEGTKSVTMFVVGRQTLGETLDRVATLACEAVPGAAVAGLTLLKNGRPTTSVFTDPTSPEIDQVQYEADAGPCLDALKFGQVLRVDSTREDDRWPEFRQAAQERGILSTLSMPLIVAGEPVGALNLYARTEAAFDDTQAGIAAAFATQAAVAVANAQAYWEAKDVGDQLHEAMKSRAVIEQAKGMLMAAQGCGPDEAFDLLVRASQRSNRKLRAIAEELVDQAVRRRAASPPSAEP